MDRIVVIGGSKTTLDMLRLATLRSDDVVLLANELDERTRLFAERFAVDYRVGPVSATDLDGAVAAVISMGDVDRENVMIRAARRRRLPIHVEGRPPVSDFTMLALLERRVVAAAGP